MVLDFVPSRTGINVCASWLAASWQLVRVPRAGTRPARPPALIRMQLSSSVPRTTRLCPSEAPWPPAFPDLSLCPCNVLSTLVLQGPAWVSWASDRLPVRTRAPPLGVTAPVLLLCVSYLVTGAHQLLSLLIVCMSLPPAPARPGVPSMRVGSPPAPRLQGPPASSEPCCPPFPLGALLRQGWCLCCLLCRAR